MERAKIIHLNHISDNRGSLSYLENEHQIPIVIKRVYWTFDVPSGDIRGGHAYKRQQEVIIALSGSFDVVVEYRDGSKDHFQLNRSHYGLIIPNGTWRHAENFSTNAVSLHLSDSEFDPKDYIREKEAFYD